MATIATAPELADFAYGGYASRGSEGPVSIVPAKLNGEDIYLVGLSGIDVERIRADGQSVGAVPSFLSGAGWTGRVNPYVNGAVAAIEASVPEGATIVIAGHSLGGMVGQQLAADDRIRDGYEVAQTVTFGSPVTGVVPGLGVDLREGDVTRLGDSNDPIPYASTHTLGGVGALNQYFGLHTESSGAGLFDLGGSHTDSYLRADTWGGYDALGQKGGTATIEFDREAVRSFRIPALIPRGPQEDEDLSTADPFTRARDLAHQLSTATPGEREDLVREAGVLLETARGPSRVAADRSLDPAPSRSTGLVPDI